MTDAERWTAEHDFTRGTEFVNNSGQKLAELLDAEPTATESGTVYPRWTFPDGSAVVLGQCTWRIDSTGSFGRSWDVPVPVDNFLSRVRRLLPFFGRPPAVDLEEVGCRS